MTDRHPGDSPPVHFDDFANGYDQTLQKGLRLSGEDRLFFAKERIRWTARCLDQTTEAASVVLDFGCGTGLAVPLIFQYFSPQHVVGIDVSDRSLEVARQNNPNDAATFLTAEEFKPSENVDLVYCNGVFHHIPPAQRPSVVCYLMRCLRPGGLLALWENNPWNPGTRIVMRRIPFDRDAITLTARESRQLLEGNGFQIVRTNYLFIFPRALRLLRWIEPKLASRPFGAQYLVLGQKPTEGR